MGHVWGDPDDEDRTERIRQAWESIRQIGDPKRAAGAPGTSTTRAKIEQTLIGQTLTERHLSPLACVDGR